ARRAQGRVGDREQPRDPRVQDGLAAGPEEGLPRPAEDAELHQRQVPRDAEADEREPDQRQSLGPARRVVAPAGRRHPGPTVSSAGVAWNGVSSSTPWSVTATMSQCRRPPVFSRYTAGSRLHTIPGWSTSGEPGRSRGRALWSM